MGDTQGMKLFGLERIEGQECHACGKFKKNTKAYWLQHLCQHYFALCPECKKKFEEFIGVTRNLELKDREFIADIEVIHPTVGADLVERKW